MTLVEMVVTIAIFAIAGMILVAGFSTVIRHMGNASLVKTTSNEVFAIIESDKTSEETTKEVQVNIRFDTGYELEDKVQLTSAKRAIDGEGSYQVQLKKFSKDGLYIDSTKIFYEKLVECMIDWIPLTKEERQKQYTEAREELIKQGITIDAADVGWISNDNFRWFFTVIKWGGMDYPEIDREIIERCNEIYLEKNATYLKNDAYYGDKKVYMKPYYLSNKKQVIMYGVFGSGSPSSAQMNGWRTRLIYNPEDNYWYYKVFKATSESDTEDSYFAMTKFTQGTNDDRVVWEQLLIDFKDPNKWRKIDMGQ